MGNVHGIEHPATVLSTTHQSPNNHIIRNNPTSNLTEPNQPVPKHI